MWDWIPPIVGAVLVLFGTYLTVRATKGRTQSDFKTAMDERIDKKMREYQQDLEDRNAKLQETLQAVQTEAEVQARDIKKLQDDSDATKRREQIMFGYFAALREHILLQLPPPPPKVPPELVDWFEDWEATFPTGHS